MFWLVLSFSQPKHSYICLVKAKAQEIAEKLNFRNFQAGKWHRKHQSTDVSQDDVNHFKIYGYASGIDQKMCMMPMKLVFSSKPYLKKTHSFRSEKCSGGKLSKKRLTILFCANMAGQQENYVGDRKGPGTFFSPHFSTIYWKNMSKIFPFVTWNVWVWNAVLTVQMNDAEEWLS